MTRRSSQPYCKVDVNITLSNGQTRVRRFDMLRTLDSDKITKHIIDVLTVEFFEKWESIEFITRGEKMVKCSFLAEVTLKNRLGKQETLCCEFSKIAKNEDSAMEDAKTHLENQYYGYEIQKSEIILGDSIILN